MNLTIQNGASAQTMTSRELYDVVCLARVECGETQPRLNDFHSRIVDELEDDNYETFVVQNPNKTESTFYRLTIEQCTLVGMRESKAVRRAVLEKLKALETNQAPAIPQTYAEALQLAADQARQLEEQAPKVEYHDKVLATENGLTTTEIAAELGMSAKKLNQILKSLKVQRYVNKRWVLTVAYINQGYDVEVTHVDDGGKSRHAMKWTEKGRKLIHELMGE